MDLLANATESIQVGIQDWQAGGRPRLLSAVRNIHAGILLLFKEALLRRSPEGSDQILIKARMKPVTDGESRVKYIGAGRKTVDAQQIRERFEGLGISTDWEKVKAISEVRNEIEHYFADVSKESLRGVIAAAFTIIRNFAVDELEEDPRELLGQATWKAMLDAAGVYAAERAECDKLLAGIEWGSPALKKGASELRCGECASDLLRPDGGTSYADVSLSCRSCGTSMESEQLIPLALDVAFDWEAYVAVTDGGEAPLAECPSCGEVTYVMDEQRCALCGEAAEHECARCGCSIPAGEMSSSPLCGYCQHMASKDD